MLPNKNKTAQDVMGGPSHERCKNILKNFPMTAQYIEMLPAFCLF